MADRHNEQKQQKQHKGRAPPAALKGEGSNVGTSAIDHWEKVATKYHKKAAKMSSVAGELKLRGTCFEFLVRDRKFWWCVLWVLLWALLSTQGVVEPLAKMPESSSKQVTYFVSVLSFVLGFFSLQTYRSFQDQGRCATALGGKVYELLFMVKVGLKDAPKVQHKVVRLVCAFTMVFWMDMAKVYSYSHLARMGLLMPKELETLQATKAKKGPFILLWALDALQVHYQNTRTSKTGTMDDFIGHSNFLTIQAKMFEIRTKFAELDIMREVDVPLVYSHCLWWLIMIFLTIVGYFVGKGCHANPGWVVGYGALVIAYVGLFDIALALKEPFGIDSVDLDPFYYINGALKNCREYMTSEVPEPEWERIGSEAPKVDFFKSTLPIDQVIKSNVQPKSNFSDEDLAKLMSMKLQAYDEALRDEVQEKNAQNSLTSQRLTQSSDSVV